MSSLPLSTTAADKENALRAWLREARSVLIAFSGGVDSSYLAFVAGQELGERALTVTGRSPSLAATEQSAVTQFVTRYRLRHVFLDTHELDNPAYAANPPDRCYFCKQELFTRLCALATQYGATVICDGTNADDLKDVRPGRRAAAEAGVASPLARFGFTKADIRERSRYWGLPTADKPASPCLASRIPYGQPVTIGKLTTIERGEEALRALGFREVRLRHHDRLARIEIAPEELPRALDPAMAARLVAALKPLGFTFITLDLEGFRSGSLNGTEAERSDL
ncbi:MAG: ATP-dependent sacrificial sulfur transferase LarE [Chloracidobacterium sp.]|nr:ATP-dependent sacrificial sulfur transferase LarE [Chloracidobacterium sp.]